MSKIMNLLGLYINNYDIIGYNGIMIVSGI